MNETTKMWQIRLKSFGFELLGLAVTGIAGFLTSDGVKELVTNHFGATIAGTIILFVVTGIAKHLRNLAVTKKVELGKAEGRIVEEPDLI